MDQTYITPPMVDSGLRRRVVRERFAATAAEGRTLRP